MKLYAPRHPLGCHIALTNGHAILIPSDPAGISVPKMFRRAAIALGCVPVGSEAAECEPTAGVASAARRATGRARRVGNAADGSEHAPAAPLAPGIDSEALVRPETTGEEQPTHDLEADFGDRVAAKIALDLAPGRRRRGQSNPTPRSAPSTPKRRTD